MELKIAFGVPLLLSILWDHCLGVGAWRSSFAVAAFLGAMRELVSIQMLV